MALRLMLKYDAGGPVNFVEVGLMTTSPRQRRFREPADGNLAATVGKLEQLHAPTRKMPIRGNRVLYSSNAARKAATATIRCWLSDSRSPRSAGAVPRLFWVSS